MPRGFSTLKSYICFSYLLALLLIFNIASCKCGNANKKGERLGKKVKEDSSKHQEGSLAITATPDKLIGTNKKLTINLQLAEPNKAADLNKVQIKAIIAEEKGGSGSKLSYQDTTGALHPITNLTKKISYFIKSSTLKPGAVPLQLPIEISPGKDVKEVVYKFQLLDEAGNPVGDGCQVIWKEFPIVLKEVKYDKATQELICIITNTDQQPLENLQLSYISQTDGLKLAEEGFNRGTTKKKTIDSLLPVGTMPLFLGKLKFGTNQVAKIKFFFTLPKSKIIYQPKTYTFISTDIQLSFKELDYNPLTKKVIYQLSNKGTVLAQEIQIKYKNISEAIDEQQVSLNGEKEQIIDVAELNAGMNTAVQELAINFQGKKHATFLFSILYAGTPILDKEVSCENKLAAIYEAMKNQEFDQALSLIKDAIPEVINYQDPTTDDSSPLLLAAKFGKKDILEALINKGADMDVQTGDGYTVLMTATIFGQEDIVRSLLDRKIDLNTQRGDLALIEAAGSGYKHIVEDLLGAGVNVDTQNKYRETALIQAIRFRKLVIAKLLLAHGANVNAQDEQGKTALMYATFGEDQQIVEALLNRGARVDLKDNSGETAFWGAFDRENIPMLKLLLTKSDKHIKIDKLGIFAQKSALHWAIMRGYKEIVEELLDRGADLNGSDVQNSNLMEAIIYDQPEIVALLLKRGARLTFKNAAGKTALALAQDKPVIKEIIENYIAGVKP